jgi:hypothetical protein
MYLYLIVAVIIVFMFMKNGGGGASKRSIEKLVRQTARWATAAQQDASPLISMLHANYAAGYLWALKDIATPTEIHKATGVNLKQFEEHIVNVQDSTTKKVIKVCPQFKGEVDLYLATIAGENA